MADSGKNINNVDYSSSSLTKSEEERIRLRELRKKNAENDVINEYLDFLITVKGYSNYTLISYKRDLVWLFRYLKIRNNKVDTNDYLCKKKNGDEYIDYTLMDVSDVTLKDLKDVTKADLIAFIGFTAKELHNNENSRKRKVTTIKGFFRYLVHNVHYLKEDPSIELEAPKIPRQQPHYLTLEQAQDLIDAPTGLHSIRDQAILTMFLNTGLRVSELINLKVTDFQKDTIHVEGKGKKNRTIYLTDSTMEALAAYLPVRTKQIEDQMLGEVEYLFISQKGSKFTTRGIEHMIEKYIKIIGLDPRKYTVHSLRHTAATLMHNYGQADIRTIQSVLGHESTQTTEIYTHLDNNEIKHAIHSNPLSRYKVTDDADLSQVFKLGN